MFIFAASTTKAPINGFGHRKLVISSGLKQLELVPARLPEQNMAKKKRRFANPVRHGISALILLGAIAATIWMTVSKEKTETEGRDSFTQTVSVYEAERFRGALEIDVSGMVDAHREIDIASLVNGNVAKRADECRAGTFVAEGTPLLWIDSTNYDLALKRFQAEKKQAEANIRELDEELFGMERSMKLAQRDYDLQERETERRLAAGSALSRSELDQARRALTSADRTLTDLKNAQRLTKTRRARLSTGIELSEVRLQEAQINIERCEIKAPFSGVVVSDMVEVGDYVTAGKNVVIFEDTSMVDVKCNLRAEQLARIIRYQMSDSRSQTDLSMAYQLPPTQVRIIRDEDGTLTEWSGMLARFDGIGLDSQTKMIPCIVEVSDPVSVSKGKGNSGVLPKALIRGMFVSVTIELNAAEFEDEVLLRIPSVAMQPGDFVWAVVDEKLERHKVDVIDRQNENDPDVRKRMVVVRAKPNELGENSAIVTTPLSQPLPGSIVKVLKTKRAENTESIDSSDAKSSEDDGPRSESTKIETDNSNAARTNSKKESNRS